MFFLKLSYRNLLRNKRRTIISAVSLALGLASLIYVDALYRGMIKNMISTITETLITDGQIMSREYKREREIEYSIVDLKNVVKKLENDKRILLFSKRIIGDSTISSPEEISPIVVYGIEPEKEKQMINIEQSIVEGEFIKGADDILIGKKLKKLLKVSVGDRVVLTATRRDTNELYQMMFRVKGVFSFSNSDLDSSVVFINLSSSKKLFGLKDNEIQVIALKFKESSPEKIKDSPFFDEYTNKNNIALSWYKLSPEFKVVYEMVDIALFIVGLILFVIVGLIIVNSLFMSIYERFFEFGVMKAIGMRESRVSKLIVYEAGVLALFSIFIGVVLGFLLTYIFSETGIDYTGIEMAGVSIRKKIFPEFSLIQYTVFPIVVFFITILVSFYPSRYIKKLSSVDLMRKSL